LLTGLGACSSGSDDPDLPGEPVIELAFTPSTVSFGEDRSRSVDLLNAGDGAVGPVQLAPGEVRDAGGNAVPGASLTVSPAQVSTLNAGATRSLTLTLEVPQSVGTGTYSVAVEARLDGQAAAVLGSSFSVVRNEGPIVDALEISGGAVQARQGEVLSFTASATDAQGQPISDPTIDWRVEPPFSGLATAEGDFVAYSVGTTLVIAEAGAAADTAEVQVISRNAPSGSFEVAWSDPIEFRYTSDHWEHEDVAFTGTWGCRDVPGGRCGNAL